MKKKMLPVTIIVAAGQLVSSCAQKPVAATRPAVATQQKAPESKRLPTSEDKEDPWTTWSEKGTVGGLLVLSRIRKNLLENNLHDPHINYSGYKAVDCSDQNTKYRSADGTCTVISKPHIGAAGVAFGRNVNPKFIDHEASEKLMNPNPILVSKEMFTRDEFKPVPFLNMLAASWIQFMNHDWLTHGKNAESNPHVINHEGEERIVERTKDNDLDPAQYKKEFGKVTLNDVTHWWDGSQIYGSNQEQQNAVRSFENGKMLTVKLGGKELLPKKEGLNIVHNKQNQGYEVTGFNDNWWVGLSMLHHLFVLEHNTIAEMLYKKHVRYDEKSQTYYWNEAGFLDKVKNVFSKTDHGITAYDKKGLDEHIFQVSRLINSAVMAKIHTVEWTPAILANDTLKKAMFTNWYGLANPQTWSKLIKKIPGMNKTDWFTGTKGGYVIGGVVGDKTKDYGHPYNITEEFTSVYRLHSLLPENLNLRRFSEKDKFEAVPFEATRNEKSYPLMESYELKDLFYSFGVQNPGQLVLNNFPKFMQELNIPGHGKMDLAMVDVIRDRERGVPRYNQFREAIGLKRISSYEDFFPKKRPLTDTQVKILEKFRKVYGVDENGRDNVDMIDLLVGTSAEEVRPLNFGFGETQFQIFILMASRRLMADRFYTSDYRKEYYTKAGLKWIDSEGYMHKVILRHMPELAPHLKRQVKGDVTAFYPWN